MHCVNIIAVFACLIAGLAVGAARNPGKKSGHHHSGVSKDFGPPQSHIHMNATEMEPKNDEMKQVIMDQCNATYPTPMDHIVQLNETGEFPPTATRDSKCFLNCIFTRFGLIDEKGHMEESIIEKLYVDKQENAHKIPAFNNCFDEKDKTGDACESTYNKVSCLTKAALDYYGISKNHNGKGDKM